MPGSKLEWANITVRLGDLQPWADNPKYSTKAQAERILKSFEKFGQVQTVAVGPHFEVYDGHQRLSALLTLHGPDHRIDARQSSRALTDAERRELVITLHTAAVGSYDWDALSGWNVQELKGWGMDEDVLKGWNNDAGNLKEMLASEGVDNGDTEPEIDRAEELLEKWQVETGDLWQIGEHRLICGDCTDAAVVERVMGGGRANMTFIDPPYNALKSWGKDEAHGGTRLDPSKWFENDNMEWSEYWKFMARMFENLQGHSVYICCDFRIYDGLKPLVEAAGYKVKHCIVWKKNVWGLGKRYRFQHEFIIYACKEKAPFYGDRSQGDIWEVDIHKTTEHNTPKPVELPAIAIKNSVQKGEIVFDGCCGSGITMVACQNLGRKCCAIEISPKYVAVTLERMSQAFPELEIKRI